MTEQQEAIDRLREIQEELQELVNEAVGLLPEPGMQNQAEAYWASHIKSAVDSSFYLGGSFIDMESHIKKLEEMLDGND